MPDNTLYYGDNLEILRKEIRHESIDLIYFDDFFQSALTLGLPGSLSAFIGG